MTDTTPEIPLEPSASRRRGPARVVGGLVAALAVVAGGIFAAGALSGGGNTPEDAVRDLFAAIEREDVLGALAQLDPGERDAVQGSLEQLTAELNRLGILEGASLAKIGGVDVRFEDLEYRTTDVRAGLATVRVGGRGATRVVGRQLPLGDFVRDLVGDDVDELDEVQTEEIVGDDGTFTTVKRGDTWYVSFGYSFAESARLDAGLSIRDLGDGVTPRGADTPDGAVRQFFRAFAELDVRRMIELLPPGEMSALHDYAGMFLSDAEASVEELDGAFTLSFPGLELKAHTDGDRSRVAVVKTGLEASFGEVSFRYEDGCAEVQMPGGGEPIRVCNDDDPAEALEAFGLGQFQPPTLSFEDKRPDLGFITVRVDGLWYVSPLRTWLDNGVAVVRLFERRDLDAVKDYFTQLSGMSSSLLLGQTSTDQGAWSPYPAEG
jgi:hypothetical protein